MSVTPHFLISSSLAWMTLVSAWAQSPAGVGSESAKAQLKRMQTAEGLGVQLFASEPMVLNPTSLDIDPRGRVWVTEGVNYRQWQAWGKLRPDGDRILILEDNDQDGEADKSTVFYQGNDINSAQGICVLENQIFVACSPDIIVLTDTDGDDKADKKEVLFTGIGGVDHDQGVHGPVIGPDGKLYFNFGNQGSQISHANGSPVTDLMGRTVRADGNPYWGGMAFRCRMDGSKFEVIGHNFRNPFELAVDSFGAVWQSDQADQGARAARINEVFECGNFGYLDELTGARWIENRLNMAKEIPLRHWHEHDPGVIPALLNIGEGVPKGMIVYEGTLLPTQFQNQIIYCDSRKQAVHGLLTEKIGNAGKTVIQNILSSKHPWFRPCDVGTAPDGSLMIADWNDATSVENLMTDQQLDSMSGRIYRIAPLENTNYTIPQPSLDSGKRAVQALKSPNASTRYSAWRRLKEIGKKATPELLALWRSTTPHFRARALHLLGRLKYASNPYLIEAVGDENASVRATAIRIAREQKTHVIDFIQRAVRDSSPAVRRECAIALNHSKSTLAPELWATIAMQYSAKDRFYLEALGIGAQGNEDAFFEAWMNLVKDDWDTPAGRDIIWRSRSKFTPAKLVLLIKDPSIDESEKTRYRRALDFLEGPEKDAALLQLLGE